MGVMCAARASMRRCVSGSMRKPPWFGVWSVDITPHTSARSSGLIIAERKEFDRRGTLLLPVDIIKVKELLGDRGP